MSSLLHMTMDGPHSSQVSPLLSHRSPTNSYLSRPVPFPGLGGFAALDMADLSLEIPPCPRISKALCAFGGLALLTTQSLSSPLWPCSRAMLPPVHFLPPKSHAQFCPWGGQRGSPTAHQPLPQIKTENAVSPLSSRIPCYAWFATMLDSSGSTDQILGLQLDAIHIR